MPLNKQLKANVLQNHLYETFPADCCSICQVDKRIYPMYKGIKVLAIVNNLSHVIRFKKHVGVDYSGVLRTEDNDLRGYYLYSTYITMSVDSVVFEANSFSFIGDIIVEPCKKIPAEYTLYYNNASLDDIWFLTNFDKSKLYWLKEFGCSVSDEGISTEEYKSIKHF